jgi:predicted DNA-binding transcriptional regulator AlpA
MEELWGAREIAQALGLSRQRVHQLSASYPDFPEPTRLGRQHVWRRAEVEKWQKAHPERPTGRRIEKGTTSG